MVSINNHPQIRRAFEGFQFGNIDIRYSTASQRKVKADVSCELVIINWEASTLDSLFDA
ncbi:DNA adenine methylase [Pseudomonas amygdali pv. morsprunorum]|nr:DNA adenine methylase [Pseudomonas amygdali pv. morsprunorum]